ncbi:MAG: hypothetical protein R3B45_15545 [Bdellovibrionota bacterium]
MKIRNSIMTSSFIVALMIIQFIGCKSQLANIEGSKINEVSNKEGAYQDSELLDDVTNREEFKYVIQHADEVAKISELRIPEKVKNSIDQTLTMEAAISLLPELLRKNISLKHGLNFIGLRGHLIDEGFSQSADVIYPRVILWDEENGFSLSWNGGLPWQIASHQMDVFDFDHKQMKFHLHQIDFPIKKNDVDGIFPYAMKDNSNLSSDVACYQCHGPNNRPIFNMYPDWGAFYGSDNDEITTDGVSPAKESNQQKREKLEYKFNYLSREGSFYRLFREGMDISDETGLSKFKDNLTQVFKKYVDDTNLSDTFKSKAREKMSNLNKVSLEAHENAIKRYEPLLRVLDSPYYKGFSDDFKGHITSAKDHFPFRPSNEGAIDHQSRSFFFRPNLRVGILYSRLNAKFIYYNYLKPSFSGSIENGILRETFLFSALDCNWQDHEVLYKKLIEKMHFSSFKSPTGRPRVHFIELLRKFQHKDSGAVLRLRDYDIRLAYNNSSYSDIDPDNGKEYLKKFTTNVMGLGYYIVGSDSSAQLERYGTKFNNEFYQNGDYYFNSYWDGSATINEYLAAMIISDPELKASGHSFDGVRNFLFKYGRLFDRFNLDKKYFYAIDTILSEDMENKSVIGWVPAPYPNDIGGEHHREGFTKRDIEYFPFYGEDGVDLEVNNRTKKRTTTRDSQNVHQQICKKSLSNLEKLLSN